MQIDPHTVKSLDYNKAFARSSRAGTSPEVENGEDEGQQRDMPPNA